MNQAYGGILNMMSAGGDAGKVLTGTVLSAAPLKVLVNGLTISGSSLWVEASLLDGYERTVRTSLSGDVQNAELTGQLSIFASCSYGQHDTMTLKGGAQAGTIAMTPGGTVTADGPGLRAGDTVLCWTPDGQQYHVMCKTVRQG